MKHVRYWMLIAITITSVCFSLWTAQAQRARPQTWNYEFDIRNGGVTPDFAEVNERGKDGWELVQVESRNIIGTPKVIYWWRKSR